jgi:hypothetical protein
MGHGGGTWWYPSSQEAEGGDHKFKTSLGYIVNPVSKKEETKKKENLKLKL